MSIPKRLKTKDVAELWGCSQSAVVELINSGRLKAINIGTGQRARYVIDPEELRRFETDQENARPKLHRPRKKKEGPLLHV